MSRQHSRMYPRDIEKCPRAWAQERYRRIVRWRSPESGGHFPSLEVPEYFVKDLQEGLAAVLAAVNAAGSECDEAQPVR